MALFVQGHFVQCSVMIEDVFMLYTNSYFIFLPFLDHSRVLLRRLGKKRYLCSPFCLNNKTAASSVNTKSRRPPKLPKLLILHKIFPLCFTANVGPPPSWKKPSPTKSKEHSKGAGNLA
ncbi:hypothetical protein OUZ56_005921 [Daphnia magna]|uniref:Uncharacterized protein n=1 Tax=Daphnia magna TaxID=35525 RepID=A0ABQ9YU46_9CRUS|nr:hypothetical protein OUZ56_005921 [Daphnia magna]